MPGDELDETTFPAWRDALAAHEPGAVEPRSYPGYPRVALPVVKPRRFGMTLERALATRRSAIALVDAPIELATLARIVHLAHGVSGDHARGPVPSAGGLQALELYLASWQPGALAPGWYHFDRIGHALSGIVDGAARDAIATIVPSLAALTGGAVLWIVAGDRSRVAARYTSRADRFLAQEAGHLMQNLCLAATACELVTVPLGGYFERAVARTLHLPRHDRVLAIGVCGAAPSRNT